MADPITSSNIEDVLSSIRRLVSEDATVERATPDVAQQATAPEAEDKLVLTPSFRVTEPEDPYQMIRALAQEERDAVDADQIDPATEVDTENPKAVAAEDDSTLAEELAEVLGDALYTEDADFADDVITVEEDSPAQDPVITPFTRSGAKAAPETAEAEEIVEDDAPSDPDPQPQTAEDDSDAAIDLLDEDVLRELIADVVREELAGALGERITRNVRKLVRREIRQMMASEDFD